MCTQGPNLYAISAFYAHCFSCHFYPQDNEISPRKPQDLRTVIRSHIVSGLVRSADFTDEETVSSLSSSSIRINLFSTPGHILTADCARVVSLNNLAKNGVVHIVDRVIQPVTMTLEASLRADGRFGTLLQLLDDAGLMDTLRDTRGHATVMAPTDEAFRLMDRDIRNRLSADNICLKRTYKFAQIVKGRKTVPNKKMTCFRSASGQREDSEDGINGAVATRSQVDPYLSQRVSFLKNHFTHKLYRYPIFSKYLGQIQLLQKKSWYKSAFLSQFFFRQYALISRSWSTTLGLTIAGGQNQL